uniref:Uncharacterized protein n=1 Tax=Triticum urartu TaxID=4572 RepID=A0A8R7QGQ6_TRIUA
MRSRVGGVLLLAARSAGAGRLSTLW